MWSDCCMLIKSSRLQYFLLSLLFLSVSSRHTPKEECEMASQSARSPVVIQSGSGAVSAVVIWMHGLGDSPYGWSGFAEEMTQTLGSYIKFILPYAPEQDVTCNQGMVMPSWMDLTEIPIRIKSPDNGRQQADSIASIHAIVDEVISSGVSADRIIIGGFSQGGALALASTIKSPHKLGGCICLSSWALPKQELGSALSESPSLTSPFLICHGDADNVVQTENGPFVAEMLTNAGVPKVVLKTYPRLGHGLCPQEQDDVLDFLIKYLPEIEK